MSISIPTIGVKSRIVPIGLWPDGQMQTPDFGLAAWYTEGPRPGEAGPAVVIAHVDSYQGPDVFFRLRELATGDEIIITRADGSTGTWLVRSSEHTPKDELPTDRIWNRTTEPVLRLITCAGAFDREKRSYTENVVIYATPTA
ncbi:MAG: sortase [Nakamurella sp.]